MKIECLLPAVAGLQVTGVAYQEKLVSLSLTTTHPRAHCPVCGNGSEKIHSRYQRRVADLPWADKQVQLLLAVRRFFCEQSECKRKVFSERLHPAIAAYARRTARLDHHLQTLALLLGGEGAALLCQLLNTSALSGDTLLKLTRKASIDTPTTPTVLGIDEWAIRKGQNYATILVDLQTRRPIELLKDAKFETVEAWLKEHPGIEIISRDRDTVFAEAGRKGAPTAIQIADRWHLLKNLGDCLKGMLETDQPALRATAAAMQEKKESLQAPVAIPVVEALQEETGLKTRQRHQQVKELRAQGWPILRIAKHLRMHRQTVKKYLRLEKVPKRRPRSDAKYRHSLTKEQTQYLAKRWQEGNTKPRQIWRELKEQGYKGVASCIYRAIAHLPARVVAPTLTPTILDQKAATRAQRPLSARSAVWLLIRPKEKLSQKSQQLLSILLQKHEQAKQAYPLAQQFVQMVKDRKADQLDNWIQQVNQTDIAQLKRFTAGLQRDYQAVKAGLSMEWSNGQVEGQINRLKLIKRQTYGRAKLDLLKKRVFYNPVRRAA